MGLPPERPLRPVLRDMEDDICREDGCEGCDGVSCMFLNLCTGLSSWRLANLQKVGIVIYNIIIEILEFTPASNGLAGTG